jgi:GNAT superfamily N-acetyltransferase
MQQDNFQIRNMTRKELDIVVEWAAKEGWNPGIHDAGCYYTADPTGFLIGLLDDEPIATISAVRYGESFGFLGFYIVKPEYRGKGYGIRIWNAAMKYLEGRNIGLDGVVAEQDKYQRSGFKPAHRSIRYKGRGGVTLPECIEIVNLASLPFEAVDSYNRPFFPEPRTQFLKCWINQPDGAALGIMQNGKLTGYSVLRKCRSGYKIGPLFADDPVLAESLYLALCSMIKPSESVYLDVPEANPSAVELAEHYNMKAVFETARMYTGQEPDISLPRIFGVTSFEVG